MSVTGSECVILLLQTGHNPPFVEARESEEIRAFTVS